MRPCRLLRVAVLASLALGVSGSAWALKDDKAPQDAAAHALVADPFRASANELTTPALAGALEAGLRRLRDATWWEAQKKIRPQLAQVGDLMFLVTMSDAKPQQSPEAASRVQRLRDAMRVHATQKPAGWSRLVAQVRSERAKEGDTSALLLANALINEVRYRDGTDGSYYPPSRFFAESGVCKDFAVAKYLLLRDAGFDPSRLRLVSLAPRYNNTPDDWHVMLVAQPDASAEPIALDSPPPAAVKRTPEPVTAASAEAPDTTTATAPTGPSALLQSILAGRKPASAALRTPAGPVVTALGASGQAERPLAMVFNEDGSASFERDAPGSARRVATNRRGVRPVAMVSVVAGRTGQSWRVDVSGVFPKWRLAPENSAAPSLAEPAHGLLPIEALRSTDS